jgi:hypothetical protein
LGDGNGLLTGGYAAPTAGYLDQGQGETGGYWVDISSSTAGNLIDGGFTAASAMATSPTASGTNLASYMPNAKLGRGNMIYVFEQGGNNYFGLSSVSKIVAGGLVSSLTLSPLQAYSIDAKMDDGIANTGNVQANYLGGVTSSGVAADPDATSFASGSAASGAYSATTCFDSGNNLYVVSYNNGQGAACGLSFKFQ